MSIQRAEQLKKEWTDRHVSVRGGVPELRRFDGLIGQVKTVNMNCRLLVEFDTPADISWYDIDPQFLVVVDVTRAAETVDSTAAPVEKKPAAKTSPTSQAADTNTGTSPLDRIRQQAAGGTDLDSKPNAAKNPLDATRAQNGDSKSTTVSPLDAIRQQNSEASQPKASTTEEPPSDETDQKPTATKVASPLDAIRAQNAATGSSASEDVSDAAAATSESASSPAQPASDTTASPLDQIRAQAAYVVANKNQDPATASAEATDATPSPISATDDAPRDAANESTPQESDGITSTPVAKTQTQNEDSGPTDSAGEQSTSATPVLSSYSADVSDSSVIEQIRRQAGESGSSESFPSIFRQVRAQAEADDASDRPSNTNGEDQKDELSPPKPIDEDVAGVEDPVKQTFRGKKLPKQDDLKVVEGIGPKIEELFRNADINTWSQLAAADPARLREILKAAGPRFQMHNPETWPAQSKFAANGQWAELEEFQDHLMGGREPGK